MSVSMAKTSNDGKLRGPPKVPFKKVFSSSQLATGYDHDNIAVSTRPDQIEEVNTFRALPADVRQRFESNNLASQFSSSLPGIFDNVKSGSRVMQNGNKENMIKASLNEPSPLSSPVKKKSARAAVIETPEVGAKTSQRPRPHVPLSAIEPSLIVSLSSYLNTIKDFDSCKLVKEIERLLVYFQDVYRKNKLEQLSGASTILLETVGTNCSKLKSAYLHLQQVQLRLQLLSNLNNDEEQAGEHNEASSAIVKATISLNQSLSQLLKWTDEVCSNENMSAPDDEEYGEGEEKEEEMSRKENARICEQISNDLLTSFQKLVEAYKALESDLGQCYEGYLNANKQIVELILAENNSQDYTSALLAANKIPTIRRRSVTPPPDIHNKIAPSRNQNGSTSTISSFASSASSNSSNFLSKSRFFPNIISNQAQKMAHHLEKKLSKSGSQGTASKSSIVNNSEKHIWSFISSSFGSSSAASAATVVSNNASNNSNNLKRSESASDVSIIPLDDLTNNEKHLLQIQSELAFQRRSHRKLSDVSILPSALEAKAKDAAKQRNAINRQELSLQVHNEARRASNPHPTQIILLESSPSHRNAQRTLENTPAVEDRPPPLPPKRSAASSTASASSARSSFASNCSNSSNSSKASLKNANVNDNDSGLGMCDLGANRVEHMHSSTVTLRPKKAMQPENVCTKCHGVKTQPTRQSGSPPPLPPPESVLSNLVSPSDILLTPTNDGADAGQCDCLHCPQHSHLLGTGKTRTRSYRRHTARPGPMMKAHRSYSIADNSVVKSSHYLSPYNHHHQPLSHSSSFPHRLSHSVSSGDNSLVPPPLPPKRRNMHEYMVMVTNYMGPTDASEIFRFSRADAIKSLAETNPTITGGAQNSASVLSLSSSDSSTLSSIHNSAYSLVTSNANEIEREQYLRLPLAPSPPPPPASIPETESSPTSVPPVLPPRRDRTGERREQVPPPPPPPVPSIAVQKQMLQRQQSNELSMVERSCRCHQSIITTGNYERTTTTIRFELCKPGDAREENNGDDTKPEEIVQECEDEEGDEEEEGDEQDVQDKEDDDADEEDEEGEEEKNMCCAICSEGTVHTEDECCLARVEVPARMLSFKTPGEEDEFLGDIDIRGGMVDALVIKATQAASAATDNTFLEVFLATYRAFLSPHHLITKLIFRYNKFSACGEKTDNIRQSIARKVVSFIILVVNEIYLYDFDKYLSDTLMEFIYQLVGRGDLVHAKCLREKCYEKIRQRDRESMALATPTSITHNISTKTATILSFKSEHLAEQMTMLDSQLFHKIEIPELLIWAQEQREELIPNLNQFTEHFNKVSFWTRSRILQCEEQKEREKYVTKFLKIMKHLRKLNNFNSYLAILSALCSAPISRLDWSKTITETIKELQTLIDSSSSFRIYRTALATAKPPCIPYIGLILQDLTFVHIGNSDFLPDGTVNIGKRYKQYTIMSQMKQFKQFKYALTENEHIISFFDNFDDSISEEAMWQISESIKPRGGGGSTSSTSTITTSNSSN